MRALAYCRHWIGIGLLHANICLALVKSSSRFLFLVYFIANVFWESKFINVSVLWLYLKSWLVVFIFFKLSPPTVLFEISGQKKAEACVKKRGEKLWLFGEVAKPVWDKGSLLLLHQFCWKYAIEFDIEKPRVQIWAISLQTFWQQRFLFFLKAVWCLISATGCCDSTLSSFWFKNTPLTSPRRLLSLWTWGRSWRCPEHVSLSPQVLREHFFFHEH